MATEVIKVVDPDNGPGTDYTSLSAWEAGEQQNLVTNDRIAIAKCRCTAGSADTTAVTIDGWTTDSTHYIKIWTDPSEGYRHNGKWTTGNKYRLEVSGTTCITLHEGYVRIDGIQVKLTGIEWSWSVYAFFPDWDANGQIRISNNIIKGVIPANANYNMGINFLSNSGTHYVWNNIVYDFINATGCVGIQLSGSASTTLNTYNNTVHNCLTGYRQAAGTFNATNCGAASCTTAFSGTINQTTCSSATPTFVDESGDDFHLAASDTTWKDAGTSNPGSGLFSDDIDGQTRPGGTAWDIGADEYVQSVTLIQSAYRFFNDDGSESGSTPAASENTGITYPRGSNLRIRIQVDASGDPPSQQYQLEYAIQGGDWEKITS